MKYSINHTRDKKGDFIDKIILLTAYWDKNMDLLMSTVQQEDFPLAENAQKDFHCGAQQAITFGRNEPALTHFHTQIRAALADES